MLYTDYAIAMSLLVFLPCIIQIKSNTERKKKIKNSSWHKISKVNEEPVDILNRRKLYFILSWYVIKNNKRERENMAL